MIEYIVNGLPTWAYYEEKAKAFKGSAEEFEQVVERRTA